MNEAKLIDKELRLYEYPSIGKPRIVNMKFLKHPITKSGVYKDEYDGELKENNKDNYGNEYKEEDIGV